MIPQRKNNYYRSLGTGDTFTVEIDSIARTTGSFCEEVVLNCQEIYENREGPMYCMYSGGIDSELLMEIFLDQGMAVTPVIVKMNSDFNTHDISWALQFCERKNINPIVYNIDINHFIKSGEVLELAKLCKTSGYQYLSTIKAALSLEGTIVTGQDEPYIRLDQSDNKWYYYEKEKWCAWANLFNSNILTGTSCPLSWSAETLAAFMLDPTVKKLGTNGIPGKLGSMSSRKHVYGQMFPMLDRPKYTGWEKIDDSTLFQNEFLQEVIKLETVYSGEFKIEYNQLVKLLCPETIV
jgi:hypothetical protein